VWLRHWGLARDPFGEANSPYVSLPSHDEAVARLVYSIERAERFVAFFAGAGLGKTTVVRRAVQQARGPRRRCILVGAATERSALLGRLADGLGRPFGEGSDPERVWRSLERAVRSATVEGCHLVFVIDGRDEEVDPATLTDLAALSAAGRPTGPNLSTIRVGRGAHRERPEWPDRWTLAIGLDRLTRSQAGSYLDAKLADAGCRDRVFTPRALTRLHCWSEGVPRGLDRLATFALMAGAVQGLEVVPPEVVDGVAAGGFVAANLAPEAS
jgi:type II secretory pathway predicted ATPase ExeA